MNPSENNKRDLNLDQSFVQCFAPIHIIQTFLGSSRANIKSNAIISITPEQKLYTFIWIICFTLSFCHFELQYYKDHYGKNPILYVACTIGVIIQYLSYLFNLIHVRFTKNVIAGETYSTINNIDGILPIKEYKKIKRKQYYWNIVILILVIAPFECGFVIYVVTSVDYPILTIFWGFGLLITYLEMLLAGSLITYLTLRLKYLNKIVKYNVTIKNPNDPNKPSFVNDDFMISEKNRGNLDLGKFILSLKEILKSYRMIVELFSFTVLNVTGTAFTWTLVIIEATVERLQGELTEEIAVITTSLWIVYYFALLSGLAYASDVFLHEVKNTREYCIYVMSYRFEGPIRKGARDILNIAQYNQPVFSVYGIFELDKCLPFKLIGIITTNVVVLIQFTM